MRVMKEPLRLQDLLEVASNNPRIKTQYIEQRVEEAYQKHQPIRPDVQKLYEHVKEHHTTYQNQPPLSRKGIIADIKQLQAGEEPTYLPPLPVKEA